MPALQIHLALSRELVIEHAVISDPVFCPAQCFIVLFGPELHQACALILKQETVFIRLLEAPDESVVFIFRRCQHVFVHSFRRIAVISAGKSPEWIVERHLGSVSRIPAPSENQSERFVLLCYVKYCFFEFCCNAHH